MSNSDFLKFVVQSLILLSLEYKLWSRQTRIEELTVRGTFRSEPENLRIPDCLSDCTFRRCNFIVLLFL